MFALTVVLVVGSSIWKTNRPLTNPTARRGRWRERYVMVMLDSGSMDTRDFMIIGFDQFTILGICILNSIHEHQVIFPL